MDSSSRIVVLVPGVGLFGLELAVLAARLRARRYRVAIFCTNPWAGTLASKAADLSDMLARRRIESPSFVAHSFGGRIVLRLLDDYPELLPARVVTLGSPLTGCGAARRAMRLPGGRWIVTPALADAACAEALAIPVGCELGSIAGRTNLLLGHLLCPGLQNDTIVAEKETAALAVRTTWCSR
ncbi:MAG TPA: alpha/beta hydrolase [Chthonomonadaceae bacterium]|nr:alpha/beta hydrolase [Chthonomonadaceae bacterium]